MQHVIRFVSRHCSAIASWRISQEFSKFSSSKTGHRGNFTHWKLIYILLPTDFRYITVYAQYIFCKYFCACTISSIRIYTCMCIPETINMIIFRKYWCMTKETFIRISMYQSLLRLRIWPDLRGNNLFSTVEWPLCCAASFAKRQRGRKRKKKEESYSYYT